MPEYRRWRHPGGSYFFTVNLADRRSDLLIREVGRLRSALAHVRASHPFHVEAAVILPEHLHMIWTLARGERDFSTRWALIKARLSRDLARGERVSSSRVRRGERGLWQRRFYEHLLRDEEDYRAHVDYIHYNPVKHGYVARPVDWPYSSIHRFIARGTPHPIGPVPPRHPISTSAEPASRRVG